MRPRYTVRHRSMPDAGSQGTGTDGLHLPGVFQCTILRALELPKPHRDVFLLKDIQGHTLQEIAAILGISIETVQVRLERARDEIGYPADPGAMAHAQ